MGGCVGMDRWVGGWVISGWEEGLRTCRVMFLRPARTRIQRRRWKATRPCCFCLYGKVGGWVGGWVGKDILLT